MVRITPDVYFGPHGASFERGGILVQTSLGDKHTGNVDIRIVYKNLEHDTIETSLNVYFRWISSDNTNMALWATQLRDYKLNTKAEIEKSARPNPRGPVKSAQTVDNATSRQNSNTRNVVDQLPGGNGVSLDRCAQLLTHLMEAEGKNMKTVRSGVKQRPSTKAVVHSKKAARPIGKVVAGKQKLPKKDGLKRKVKPKAVLRVLRSAITETGRTATPLVVSESYLPENMENEPPTRDTDSQPFASVTSQVPLSEMIKFDVSKHPMEPFKPVTPAAFNTTPQTVPPFNRRLTSSTPTKYPPSFFVKYKTGKWEEDSVSDILRRYAVNLPLNSSDQVKAINPAMTEAELVPKLMPGQVEFQPPPSEWLNNFMSGRSGSGLPESDNIHQQTIPQPSTTDIAQFDNVSSQIPVTRNYGIDLPTSMINVPTPAHVSVNSATPIASTVPNRSSTGSCMIDRPPLSPFRPSFMLPEQGAMTTNPSPHPATSNSYIPVRTSSQTSVPAQSVSSPAGPSVARFSTSSSLNSEPCPGFELYSQFSGTSLGSSLVPSPRQTRTSEIPNTLPISEHISSSPMCNNSASKSITRTVTFDDKPTRDLPKSTTKNDRRSSSKERGRSRFTSREQTIASQVLCSGQTQTDDAVAAGVDKGTSTGTLTIATLPVDNVDMFEHHRRVATNLKKLTVLLRGLKQDLAGCREQDVELHDTINHLSELATTDWLAEFELANQPLRSENAQLRRRLRLVNQQLRDRPPEQDATSSPDYQVVHMKMEVHALQQKLAEEKTARKRTQDTLHALQEEAGKASHDKHQLLSMISTKDTDHKQWQQDWIQEVHRLRTQLDAARQDLQRAEREINGAGHDLTLAQVTITQKEAEIDKLHELIRGLQLSMSRLLHDLQTSRPNPVHTAGRISDGLMRIDEILNGDLTNQLRERDLLHIVEVPPSPLHADKPADVGSPSSLRLASSPQQPTPTRSQRSVPMATKSPESVVPNGHLYPTKYYHSINPRTGEKTRLKISPQSTGQQNVGSSHVDSSWTINATLNTTDSYMLPAGASPIHRKNTHPSHPAVPVGNTLAPVPAAAASTAVEPALATPAKTRKGPTVKDLLSPYTDRLQTQYKRMSLCGTDSDPGRRQAAGSSITKTTSSPITELDSENEEQVNSANVSVEGDELGSTLVDDFDTIEIQEDELSTDAEEGDELDRMMDLKSGFSTEKSITESGDLLERGNQGNKSEMDSRYSVTNYFDKYTDRAAVDKGQRQNGQVHELDEDTLFVAFGNEDQSLSQTSGSARKSLNFDAKSRPTHHAQRPDSKTQDGANPEDDFEDVAKNVSQESLYKGTELDITLSSISENDAGSTLSNVSSIVSTDDAAFKEGLASLDANIARIQSQLQKQARGSTLGP